MGGVQDLILDGRTGFIARPRDAVDFAEKIGLLLENVELRAKMAADALKFASTKSWGSINKNLLNDYALIISEYCRRQSELNKIDSDRLRNRIQFQPY